MVIAPMEKSRRKGLFAMDSVLFPLHGWFPFHARTLRLVPFNVQITLLLTLYVGANQLISPSTTHMTFFVPGMFLLKQMPFTYVFFNF